VKSGRLTVEDLAGPPPGFLQDDLEGEALYRAFGDAGVQGFDVGYLRVWRDGAPVATAPYFRTRYAINTTLPRGWLKRLLRPFWIRMVAVGSPVADYGKIDGEVSAEVLEALNAALAKKAPIIAYKDFPPGMPLRGFASEPGLPVAVLEIKGDFYSGHKQHVRSDFRRRMRKAAALRIEEHDGYPKFVAERLHELYLQVLEHSEFSLEKLTPEFFEKLGPISKYALYWEGSKLIGWSLLLCGRGRMHYKYLGMDYERGRRHGLYFIMCLSHIEICLRDGITTYQTGATSYPFKQRLGSTLQPVRLYFRHRNLVLNWVIQRYMTLASFEDAVGD
jgi:hypothetical protein